MNFKKIADWFKFRQQRISQAITGPIAALRILKTLLSKGAVEVATTFEYQGKKLGFQTIVQIDGDIIFYLPDPRKLDEHGLSSMQSAYNVHKNNVEKIVAAFSDNSNFFGRAFDSFLLILNFYPLLELGEELLELLGLNKGSFDGQEFGWNTIFVAASLIARKFLRPRIFSLSVRAIMTAGQWFKLIPGLR